jgi:hypothetical protein
MSDDRGCATRPGWLLEPMLGRCGFEVEAAERSEDGIFAKYVLRAATAGTRRPSH